MKSKGEIIKLYQRMLDIAADHEQCYPIRHKAEGVCDALLWVIEREDYFIHDTIMKAEARTQEKKNNG